MSAFQKKNHLDFKTQYGLGFDPQDDERSGLKWAGKKKPRVISLENVKQIL